jgi:hypothetical protein
MQSELQLRKQFYNYVKTDMTFEGTFALFGSKQLKAFGLVFVWNQVVILFDSLSGNNTYLKKIASFNCESIRVPELRLLMCDVHDSFIFKTVILKK